MADKSEAHSKMLSNRFGQAINNGELEHVIMYIEQGANVNRKCYLEMNEEWYPLALACLRHHEEIVVELIKAGAHNGELEHVCCHGRDEIMEELLKAGTAHNQVLGMWSASAMFILADKFVLTLSMLRVLISHGADVNFRDDDSRTISHCLASGQFNDTDDNILSAAKLVLGNGASVDARDVFDNTPLYLACTFDNIDLVDLFIAEGADVNFNIGDETMLRWVVDRCNIDTFDSLLNAGANMHLNPDALVNPCKQNNHATIARILDNCDMDINMPLVLYGRMTILQYACDDRRITSETVRLLLNHGADVRAVTDTGNTALHYAARKCDCNKIRQLLSYNPPLNIKNNNNRTPLSILIEPFLNYYSLSRQQADTQDQRDYVTSLYQSICLLAFKMLVTAGAKVTADDEHKLNQFRIKHPEAQLPDCETHSTRSLKELCRFVIRGMIPVPVVVSLCKLPIPKLLQEYLNFPEMQPVFKEINLVNKYNIYLNILIERDLDYMYLLAEQ